MTENYEQIETERTSIYFDVNVVKELRTKLPVKLRSKFVNDATAQALKKMKAKNGGEPKKKPAVKKK